MLLLALLFAVGASVLAKQNDANEEKATTLGNFLESTRRCDKQLVYKIVPLSALPPETFRPYANTSAQSEEECARKCIERTIFCAAARFLDLEKACQFSAKYIDCGVGQAPQRSSPENIIHCVQCGAQKLAQVSQPRPVVPVARSSPTARSLPTARSSPTAQSNPTARLSPATVRSNSVAIVPRTTSTRRPTINPPHLVERSQLPANPPLSRVPPFRPTWQSRQTLVPFVARAVRPLLPVSSISLSNLPSIPAFTELTRTTQTPETNDQSTLTNQETQSTERPIEELVSFAVANSNGAQNLIPRPNAPQTDNSHQCMQEMMKPCILGFGRDCKLTKDESSGCPICACPYKSPARGCAGPQGLKALDRNDMLQGREKCPNDHAMQIVHRWYRKVDRSTGIDECYPEKEPYCGWQQDVNIWRMPRTKDECNYYCYSDDELRSKSITFFRL